MVGLEATDNTKLDLYNKNTTIHQNEECIRILSENNILCAGLFIVSQDMTLKDFKMLYKWISSRPIIPTVSIFTPMQGAKNYDEYKEEILTKDIRKQDLFHCILQPQNMGNIRFTFEYYKLSLKLAFCNRKNKLYKCIGMGDFLYIFKVILLKLKRIFSL